MPEAALRGWYRRVCSPTEIDRVLSVRNAKDYLLRLRADTIADDMRLFRVYRNMSMAAGPKWSLEASFSDAHYVSFLASLDEGTRRRCQPVVYGDLFSREANGHVFITEYGPIVTISAALRFFLQFAHLALLRFPVDVPDHVRAAGLCIGVRVMLQTETLDFLMDPRGILPAEVDELINKPIEDQLCFVAGHEFAHYLLGHVDSAKAVHSVLAQGPDPASDGDVVTVFTHSQAEELEADIYAIELLRADTTRQTAVLEAALLWFGCLELYEAVRDTMYPGPSGGTHPSARQRYEHLLTNAPIHLDAESWRAFLHEVDGWKESLLDHVNNHLEVFDTYGSVHLDAPNTEWRGRELVDRVDYY